MCYDGDKYKSHQIKETRDDRIPVKIGSGQQCLQ